MLLLLVSTAFAQSPVDIGVIKNEDVRVVQKVLYTKEHRFELGAGVGIMPFDGKTFAPQGFFEATSHLSETMAIEGQIGGGYGLTTSQYHQDEAVGLAREAYRYLASIEADVQYTPVYAKMNLGGRNILHNDVYVLAGLGATLEQSVFPSADIAIAPSLPIGIGTRVWLKDGAALRFEIRDSVMVEHRAESGQWYPKQNVALSVGYAHFGKKGGS